MERDWLIFKTVWYTCKVSMSHVVTFRARPVLIFPHSNVKGFGKNPVCLSNAVALSLNQ